MDKAIVKFAIPETDKEITMNLTIDNTNLLHYDFNISESFKEIPQDKPCLAFYLANMFVDALNANTTETPAEE